MQGVLHPCWMYTLGAVCRAWRRIVFHGSYQIRRCLCCEYLMCTLEQIQYIIIPVDKGIEFPWRHWAFLYWKDKENMLEINTADFNCLNQTSGPIRIYYSVFVSVGGGGWRKGGSQWTVELGLHTAATYHQWYRQDATGNTHTHTHTHTHTPEVWNYVIVFTLFRQ